MTARCVALYCSNLTNFSSLQYEPDSAPALALNATIDRTEKRFATYARQGLLCGPDGLPHLISDPGLAIRYGHAGETLVSVSSARLHLLLHPVCMLEPSVSAAQAVHNTSCASFQL